LIGAATLALSETVSMMKSPTSELYSIVVIGNMNPHVHVPAWYLHKKLIDDSEYDEATNPKKEPGPNLVISFPPHFKTGQIEVICFQNRWDIKTSLKSNVDRILDIAAKVFDDLLPETQIAAFGINTDVSLGTDDGTAGKIIAKALHRPPLDVGLDKADDGEFRISEQRQSHKFNLIVRPNDKNNEIIISTNAHYLIGASLPPGTPFSLKEKLHSEFSPRRAEFEGLIALVSSRLLEA
jgi:hypothetical protein